MDYKNKIKELREHLPVPITEALSLLKENEGDVEKCIYLFKAKSIKYICEQTGCEETTAIKYYESEKFDLNRAISAVREELFDRDYTPIEGLTLTGLEAVSEWIYLSEEKDFPTSLDYQKLSRVIETLSLLPSFVETSHIIGKSKQIKKLAFDGYSDDDDIAEFVRRNQKIDDDLEFQGYSSFCMLKLVVLKEEIHRHKRNLIRIKIN